MDAPTGKKNYTGLIVLGVVLMILTGIGVIYYMNKDFFNLSAVIKDKPKVNTANSGAGGSGNSATG